MELVFEIINRSGHTLEHHKLAGKTLSIGRAFDNDLILPDHTVNPHHAIITEGDDQQLQLEDAQSLNGIRNKQHECIQGKVTLTSGDEYTFGKTRLRIYELDHPVTETVNINCIDWAINHLGRAPAMIITFLLLIGISVVESWLNVFSDIKWQSIAATIIIVPGAVVIVALFWALIGRIVKHEMHFRTQFTIVGLYLLASFSLEYINELFLFNSLHSLTSLMFAFVNNLALLAVLFWFNLYIATNQPKAQRWKVAGVISLVLISMTEYQDIIAKLEFSDTPIYIAEIKPPVMRVAQGISEEAFIQSSAEIFSQSESLLPDNPN